jgi:hypothetical protein
MPSRNKLANAAELVSLSLNWTNALSLCNRSDMVNAPLTPHAHRHFHRIMMNKSLLGRDRESSGMAFYGFQPI